MAHRQDAESGSINRRDTATLRGDYAAWLAEQPLSTRTREAYLAAVTAFVAWLGQRDAGPGDALVAPRARDLAARDYKRDSGWNTVAPRHSLTAVTFSGSRTQINNYGYATQGCVNALNADGSGWAGTTYCYWPSTQHPYCGCKLRYG